VAVQVELLHKAKNDLKRLGRGPDRKAVIDALTVGLATIPPSGNLDIKALKGAAPWLRLRVGDYRILYRPLTSTEVEELEKTRRVIALAEQDKLSEAIDLIESSQRPQQRAEASFLVARIVHRRDLERAVRALPT
jgi:mRNA-degrading endonuclease RelE of RelBE toxin-antitoxin system